MGHPLRKVLNKFKNLGNTNRKYGSSMKRKTTKRIDNLIIRNALKARRIRITAEKLRKEININVTQQTIRNGLMKQELDHT